VSERDTERLAELLFAQWGPFRRKYSIPDDEARAASLGDAKWLIARGVSVDSIPGWAEECLGMIREDLEAYGVDMSATPPMMYNDALRHLVSKLGLKAGFTDTREIAAYLRYRG